MATDQHAANDEWARENNVLTANVAVWNAQTLAAVATTGLASTPGLLTSAASAAKVGERLQALATQINALISRMSAITIKQP